MGIGRQQVNTGAARRLDDCLTVRAGALYVEDCRAEDIAERFGTPLYVISEDQLRRNARRFGEAFASRWPGPLLLLPSIKANSCLGLRRILNEEGTGCDVFGAGELEAALRTGTNPARISLNGPMKDPGLLERAIREGARITLDSRAELERTIEAARRIGGTAQGEIPHPPRFGRARRGLRDAPDGLSISEAVQRYKAGIPSEDLLAIEPAELRDVNLDASGLMLHLGRHSADPTLWGAAVDALSALLERLRERWRAGSRASSTWGGGFPPPAIRCGALLPYAPMRAAAPATSSVYAGHLARLAGRRHALGRARIVARDRARPGADADAGIHLATVGNVKRQSDPMPLISVETDS